MVSSSIVLLPMGLLPMVFSPMGLLPMVFSLMGLLSMGLLSMGLLSMGLLSMGLLSMGLLSMGLLSMGLSRWGQAPSLHVISIICGSRVMRRSSFIVETTHQQIEMTTARAVHAALIHKDAAIRHAIELLIGRREMHLIERAGCQIARAIRGQPCFYKQGWGLQIGQQRFRRERIAADGDAIGHIVIEQSARQRIRRKHGRSFALRIVDIEAIGPRIFVEIGQQRIRLKLRARLERDAIIGNVRRLQARLRHVRHAIIGLMQDRRGRARK